MHSTRNALGVSRKKWIRLFLFAVFILAIFFAIPIYNHFRPGYERYIPLIKAEDVLEYVVIDTHPKYIRAGKPFDLKTKFLSKYSIVRNTPLEWYIPSNFIVSASIRDSRVWEVREITENEIDGDPEHSYAERLQLKQMKCISFPKYELMNQMMEVYKKEKAQQFSFKLIIPQKGKYKILFVFWGQAGLRPNILGNFRDSFEKEITVY